MKKVCKTVECCLQERIKNELLFSDFENGSKEEEASETLVLVS